MELLNIILSKAYEIGILFICKHLCSKIFFMHYLNVLKTTSLKDLKIIVNQKEQVPWPKYNQNKNKRE